MGKRIIRQLNHGWLVSMVFLAGCGGLGMPFPEDNPSVPIVAVPPPPAPLPPTASPPGEGSENNGNWANTYKENQQVEKTPRASSPTVIALLNQAQNKEQAGQLNEAAAALERAMRVEPRNGILWYRLALLRLKQQKPKEAIQLALKSISLSNNNKRVVASDWRIIYEARLKLGDKAGAEKALNKAREFGADL